MAVNGPDRVTDFGGLKVLFVMATTQEYGPALERLFTPVITGVGPVEAAAGTAAALARLEAAGALPDLVVSLGSAGSRKLDHALIYQVASVVYRDIDASPFGFARGQTPFADFPPVLEIPLRIADIPTATISTGGKVHAGADYEVLEEDMVDMETFAVLRAAARFGVPTIGLRGISDGRDDVTGLHDWTEYLHEIDGKLAACLERWRDDVAAGRFVLGTEGGAG